MTRNLEIGNTPVWVLPNIWRLDWVMDTTFVTNVSNRMLLNPAKFQGYSVYHFWVIKRKPTEGNLNNEHSCFIYCLIPSLEFLFIHVLRHVLYWRTFFSYIFFSIFVVYLLYDIRLIELGGDIEPNPCPQPSSRCFNFSIYHWNLVNITAHDCLKVKLLTVCNLIHSFESHINSETLWSDDNVNIPG